MKCTHVIAAAVALVASVTVFSCADSVDNPVEKAAQITLTNRQNNNNVATVVSQILDVKDGDTANITVTGNLFVKDVASIKNALVKLESAGGGYVNLDFSDAAFPDNTVPADSLSNCDRLLSVVLPDSLTKIDSWAFCANYNLTSINIPSSVKEIGDCAFAWTGITTAIIPEGVKSLSATFEGCGLLSTVAIPASVTEFKDFNDTEANNIRGLFKNCTSLARIFYAGSSGKWNAIDKSQAPNMFVNSNSSVDYKYNVSFAYIAIYNNETWNINDNYTIPTGSGSKLYILKTVPGVTYKVYWCDGYNIRNYPNSFVNAPENMVDVTNFNVCDFSFYTIRSTDDEINFTFTATGTQTLITMTLIGDANSTCAFPCKQIIFVLFKHFSRMWGSVFF